MNNETPPFFRGEGMAFGHHGVGGGALAWTIFALQLLLIAGLIVLLVRVFATTGPSPAAPRMRFRQGHAPGPGPDPLSVVRMRYARGEMTRDEYVQATQDLGGTPEAPTEELPPS